MLRLSPLKTSRVASHLGRKFHVPLATCAQIIPWGSYRAPALSAGPQFSFADLLRQSVRSRLAGYEDLDDAQRLPQDPTFRLIGSEKIWDRGTALTSRLQTFETDLLVQDENLAGLATINRELIAKAETLESQQRVVLDIDSTEIPVWQCGSMVRRIASLALPAAYASRRPEQNSPAREAGAGKLSEAQVERGSVSSFGMLPRDKTGPFHGPWRKHPALKSRLDLDLRGARVYIIYRAKTENGNCGANFPVGTSARSCMYAPG